MIYYPISVLILAGIRENLIISPLRLTGIAYRKSWITADKLREEAQPMLKNQYGQYLLKVIDEVERTGEANLD